MHRWQIYRWGTTCRRECSRICDPSRVWVKQSSTGRHSVSSADFRRIAAPGSAGRSEKLFRAAVSAYCSLTRPTRGEAAQLDDLTLPLYRSVSREARRMAAAALSECRPAPPLLTARLASEELDVATPLLLRSSALGDIELLAIIGRHGLDHARVIARREALNPTIRDLVASLELAARRKRVALAPAAADPVEATTFEATPEAAMKQDLGKPSPAVRVAGEAEERTREQLRAMMRPAGWAERHELTQQRIFSRLRDTALTGVAALFQTALADALGIDFASARRLAESADMTPLVSAFRVLELEPEEAFLLACAVRPSAFAHAEAIRLFLERYRIMEPDSARGQVRDQRAESLHRVVGQALARPNDNRQPAEDAPRILRAS